MIFKKVLTSSRNLKSWIINEHEIEYLNHQLILLYSV